MLLKETFFMFLITNFALIRGKKAIPVSKVQTTLECCKKNNVPVGCLGLCSIVKPMKMISTPERYTDCSEYKYVIDACFQPASAQWEEWEEYSDCTKTCGSGRKRRIRTCNIPGKCPSDGEVSQTVVCNVEACPKPTISTTTEPYLPTTLPSDDDKVDDKRCKPFVDCSKDNEVALKYCPNYCLEEEICKTVDCTKPKASTICPRSCAEGENEDTGTSCDDVIEKLCKIADCSKPGAKELCPHHCKEDIGECASSPCQNGGTCVDGLNSYTCICNVGYVGDNCEMDADKCTSNPCLNNGKCTDGINSFTCDCVPGYFGDNCESVCHDIYRDVGIILDVSGSMCFNGKGWDRVRDKSGKLAKAHKFIKDLANIANFKLNGGHGAFMLFSKNMPPEEMDKISFSEQQDLNNYLETIDSIIDEVNKTACYDGTYGATDIINALDVSLARMFQSSSGMREDADQVAVLITDGQDSGYNGNKIPEGKLTPKYVEIAQRFKDRKIKILAIGVGDVSDTNLRRLVQSPQHFFKVEKFADLVGNVTKEVASVICDEKDPGQLSPNDFAIDCCKSKGVPRFCLGDCVPGGKETRKKYAGIRCSKYRNKSNTCKKEATTPKPATPKPTTLKPTSDKPITESPSALQGPIHSFNGNQANFYISTGQGGCSVNWTQIATVDAQYFCSSFYGSNYKVVSYEIGSYSESGRLGYQMHKGTGCTSKGSSIDDTDCSGVNCMIWTTNTEHEGLYDIICSSNMTNIASSNMTNITINAGPCVDGALQNVKNLTNMKNGGWVDNGIESGMSIPRTSNYAPPCGGYETFWGYRFNTDIGYVKASFKGEGTGTLDFGNCYQYGKTRVYLNNKRIAEASPYHTSEVIRFNYKKGDVLKITEEEMGIIKINSFKLDACEEIGN